jgi:hypothetical protein
MIFNKEKFDIPTDVSPFVYKDIESGTPMYFYNSFVDIEPERYYYKDLKFIVYSSKKQVVNGFTTVHKVVSVLYFLKDERCFFPDGEDDFDQFIMLDFQKGILPIKNNVVHRLDFIVSYLKEITFEQRLKRYIWFFTKDGSITIFEEVKFTNNGDIFDKGKRIGNIIQAQRQGNFFYGNNFTAIKNSYADPYTFGIYLSNGFLGLGKKSWSINMCIDKDIFDYLLPKLFQNGNFVSSDL